MHVNSLGLEIASLGIIYNQLQTAATENTLSCLKIHNLVCRF